MVHLRVINGFYACGRVSAQGFVEATDHKTAVTCEACKDTPRYRALRVKLPRVEARVF